MRPFLCNKKNKKSTWISVKIGLLFIMVVSRSMAVDFPPACRMFILKHFPREEIAHVEIEESVIRSTLYHIVLTNGIDIHFKQLCKEWTQVKGNAGNIPNSLFPEKLVRYIERFYPGCAIRIADRYEDYYQIKLEDGTELCFDCYGNPKECYD